MRFVAALFSAALAATVSVPCGSAARTPTHNLYSVGYTSSRLLESSLRGRGAIVRNVVRLRIAEVRLRNAGAIRHARGIRFVQRVVARTSSAEPALVVPPGVGIPYEWQFDATRENLVPQSVLRAAADVTIAVIDSGSDLSAPDLAAKAPRTYNLHTQTSDSSDPNGHGTFVSSLAAGSVTNNEGISGFGGDAKLLVVKASHADGTLTDVDEANAIVYAVDHGARVINLSVGGPDTSFTERRGIQYAIDHDVLIVAAAGNEYDQGDPPEYPATLLQPLGSNGRGGFGLAVGASTDRGARAFFSNTGSEISLVAPGENVFGAVSSMASTEDYPRTALPGSIAGSYGFASGTSFAAPEVAGVAALVFAANPLLHADQVTQIIKETASGGDEWNRSTGYGVVDAAAAVARAAGEHVLTIAATRSRNRLDLHWSSPGAVTYRVIFSIDDHPTRVLLASTTRTRTAFTLTRGHRYVFTVTGFDAGGTETAAATYIARR